MPSAFPFQWLALWPKLALCLENNELADAPTYTSALLHAAQQRVPSELSDALSPVSSPEHLRSCLNLAIRLGYL